jgi:regulatory protein
VAPVGSDAAATARALELAYRYLSRRERTVYELRSHLVTRDLDPGAVDAAVEELTETGYLDDVRYARLFVEDKRRLARWGSGRIRSALLSRGVERGVIDAALSEEIGQACDADDRETETELDRAVSLLRQRFPDPPRERRDRQRALGVLIRRGYELELALDALAAFARGKA